MQVCACSIRLVCGPVRAAAAAAAEGPQGEDSPVEDSDASSDFDSSDSDTETVGANSSRKQQQQHKWGAPGGPKQTTSRRKPSWARKGKHKKKRR